MKHKLKLIVDKLLPILGTHVIHDIDAIIHYMKENPIKLSPFEIEDEKEEIKLLQCITDKHNIKTLAIVSNYIKRFNAY